jgi:hypothetical protein
MASIRSSLSEGARTSEVVPSYVDLVFVARALSLSGSGIMPRISPKILSGATKPVRSVIPTGQRWNPKRYLHYPYPGAFSRDRNQQGAGNHFTRASLAPLFQPLTPDGERCQSCDGSRALSRPTKHREEMNRKGCEAKINKPRSACARITFALF